MFTVYILELKGRKRFYVGVTGNFERRLAQHKANQVISTKHRFLRVFYKKVFKSKKEAYKEEIRLKKTHGRMRFS